jgi:CRISPR-associated protein Cmr6
MPEKPKPKPKLKQGVTNQPSEKPSTQLRPAKANTSAVLSSYAKDIPLMFQAQTQDPDRGNIQYVGDREDNAQPKYEVWVEEWLKGCPPKPEPGDESIPKWKRKPVQILVKLPQFGAKVKTWEYQIRWRMVTNSGQDDDLIRPVIGAKGIPFFPGSSMKGAFRNACPEEKRLRYCGGEVVDADGNKRTKPGILRFHGGYPVGMDWAQAHRLVDIAHGQQPYQVMRSTKDRGENANVQISLYQPKFKFGISCPEIPLDSTEWDEVKGIWEKALGYGIGSRVSAGYGYVKEVQPSNDRVLASVCLNGQGVSSQLLLKATKADRYKTPEFRPNMFKAALRGHTLRILGGLIDEQEAKSLTQKIWGGIPEKGGKGEAIVGCVGIDFSIEEKEGEIQLGEHVYNQITKSGRQVEVKMPIYRLSNGRLNLIHIGEVTPELETFLISLIKFSILFGGFGKSWRRIHHKLFYPSYFNKNDKPMIGCHWTLTETSQDFLINPNSDLSGITNFIEELRSQAIAWIRSELGNYQPGCSQDWREAWYSDKVQVWGRSTNKKSYAVAWFHRDYVDQQTIYKSVLTGSMGKIGRMWHRMYPFENVFIELLTIFPDQSRQTKDFLNFLASDSSGFSQLWGNEQS